MKRNIVLVVGFLTVISVTAFFVRGRFGSGSTDHFSYTLGHEYGLNLKRQNIAVLDTRSFIQGVEDVLKGQKILLSPEQMSDVLRAWQKQHDSRLIETSKTNQDAGSKFASEFAKQSDVKTTASGLRYRLLKSGTGAPPKPTDVVKVHYVGKLIDGTEFDSSVRRGKPDELPLKSVIPGWTEVLQLMSPGAKAEVVIPSTLGYGNQTHPKIPPGSTLHFEIELLEIK